MPDLSSEQEVPLQLEEEEEDVDQLLNAVAEPVSSRPRLNRLKRARKDVGPVEVPASKRCETEDAAAALASPSSHAGEASTGERLLDSAGSPSAPRSSYSREDTEENHTGVKSASAERQEDADAREGSGYWDEEDELEEYVMRRDLGQIKDDDADGSGSDSDSGDSAAGSKGGGNEDADSDDGAMDPKQLAAETQRILRDAARSDRIGKGAAPEIQPLSGVLAKIMQRKEEAISRAAKLSGRAATAKTPEQKPKKDPKPEVSPVVLDEDDGDLLLVDSDDDEAAQKATAKRALAQEESQLFGLESQSLPDMPNLATRTTPAQAQPKPRTGLMSFMQRGPLLDTQDLIGSELVVPKLQIPSSETEAAAAAAEVDTEGPQLKLCLDTEPQAELPTEMMNVMQAPDEEAGPQEGASEDDPAPEEADREDESEEAEQEELSSDDEGHADDEGSEEEEEFLSSDDSSSDEEEESEAGKALDSASKQRALEEARALLRDEPRAKNKSAYFEDEAEMSEDGGHSDDGDSGDEDGDDQDGILEDLIGLEKDGKHDEKRRAALHAAWLERQDAAAVEQLMDGVKNGFRRKRNALDDEGGTNHEAALRRAALMNTDDEGSQQEASESKEEARSEQADPFENIDALSDEEAKEELREAQQRRLMEESQKEEDNIVTLLDDEARAVLGLLQRGSASAAAPTPALPLRPKYPSDHTNRPAKGSFLKRGSSSNPMALLAKSGSQMGNTRSFVFGCENSNSGAPAGDSQPPGNGSQPATVAGPTSFAGIHVGTSAAGVRPRKASVAEGPSNLLGMLHSKMHRKAQAAGEQEIDAAGVQMKSIMTGKKRRQVSARKV